MAFITEQGSIAWRERRLGLDGLPRSTQFLAALALGCTTMGCLAILALGFGVELPGGLERVSSQEQVPAVLALYVFASLAIAAASIVAAALRSGPLVARLILISIALAAGSMASDIVHHVQLIETLAGDERRLGLTRALGWLILAAALALAVLPARTARILPGLAAAPFAIALMAYVTADGTRYAVPDDVLRARDTIPDALSARTGVASAVLGLAALLGIAVSLLLLWQVLEGVRVAIHFGVGAGRVAAHVPRVLAVVLIAKLLWIGLAYARLPPHGLGDLNVWTKTRADGLVAWLLGAFFAAVVAIWLDRRYRTRVAYMDIDSGARLVIAGFTLFALLAAFAGMLARAASLVEITAGARAAGNIGDWLGANLVWSQVGTVAAALFLAVGMMRKRSSSAWFLLLFAAWSLPRAIRVVIEPDRTHPLPVDLATDLITLDTCVTFAIAILAVCWWTGRRTGGDPAALMLVLFVSTAVAYSFSALFLDNLQRPLFYLGLVLPVAYTFLAESTALNRRDSGRPTRVLAATGLTAIIVTLVAVRVSLGWIGPGAVNDEELAQVLFAVPFAATLVVATLAAHPTRSYSRAIR